MDIRNDLFTHIQKLPFDYFDGVNTGEIMPGPRKILIISGMPWACRPCFYRAGALFAYCHSFTFLHGLETGHYNCSAYAADAAAGPGAENQHAELLVVQALQEVLYLHRAATRAGVLGDALISVLAGHFKQHFLMMKRPL